MARKKEKRIQKKCTNIVTEKKVIPRKSSPIDVIMSSKKIHPPTSTKMAHDPPTFRVSNGRVIRKRVMTSEANNSRPMKKSRWGLPQRPYQSPCSTIEQKLMGLSVLELCCFLERMGEEEQLKLMMQGHPWDMVLGGREKMWRLCHKINMKKSIQRVDKRMRVWVAVMGIRDPNGLQVRVNDEARDLGVLP